jgi:hypothetical protein
MNPISIKMEDSKSKRKDDFVFCMVLGTGLVTGMIVNTSFETFLNSPVKSALTTAVGGFCGMLTAGMVSGFLPNELKILVPFYSTILALEHLKKQ